MNRSDHMAWCKKRALAYVDQGDNEGAFASMMSDISKHDETCNPILMSLGMTLKMGGKLDTSDEMRKFIEGFN